MTTGMVCLAALIAVSAAADQPPPAALNRLLLKARIDQPVVAWCPAEFRPTESGAFAVAVQSPTAGGRYLAVEADATIHELASFTGRADVSCYSREQAEGLNVTLRRSATIHGRIAPRWNTTIVCGFVDNTAATCWQYSPADDRFVKVGEWVT
jgi:hypothetical protein